MARPFFIAATPLTDLDTQQIRQPLGENRAGLFIPVSVKFFVVTAFLWTGLMAVSISAMVGAWSLGVSLAAWTAR